MTPLLFVLSLMLGAVLGYHLRTVALWWQRRQVRARKSVLLRPYDPAGLKPESQSK